jgi:hypothetical protein
MTVADVAAPGGRGREGALRRYPARLRPAYGRKRPVLVDAALRLRGDLTDGRDGDLVDRTVAALTRRTSAV